MKQKIVSVGLVLAFFLTTQFANAASTCDYSEQVKLSSAASVVQAKYDIKRVVIDVDGKVVPDMNPDDVTEDDEYAFITSLKVNLLNLSNDIYVLVKGDNGYERTFYYSDSNQGIIEFDGGDLSKIVRYKITIYSNSNNCKGEVLRNIDLTTPMINSYAYLNSCYLMPNFEYCKEYITTPFYASETDIMNEISKEYEKYKNTIVEEEENKEEKSFLDKLRDFYQKNKIIIFCVIGVVLVACALVTVVVIRKQRSRIL